ncbi:hypothetical protein NKI48_29780 [Mesorhizobium sp. M0644]|uniref:hypothetical protein n=1 Tax=unclassified Mesorhizobium TaxID=325217 RepID=UPI003337F595
MDALIKALQSIAANFPSMLELADLQAQQDMAFWSEWMFWISAASVVLSAAALVALYTSLRQTRTAIRVTREIGEVQTRAFIVIKAAQCLIYNAGSEAEPIDRVQFKVTAKVCGQTPAQDVSTRFEIKAHFSGAKADDNYDSPDAYFGGMVPNDEFDAAALSWPLGDEHDDILMAQRAFELRGVITYRPVTGESLRRTEFAYYFGEHGKLASEGRDLLPIPILDGLRST